MKHTQILAIFENSSSVMKSGRISAPQRPTLMHAYTDFNRTMLAAALDFIPRVMKFISSGHRIVTMLNSPAMNNDNPPPYFRHDWEQVKLLWSNRELWSLRAKLRERRRILEEVFVDHGWPLSTEALRALQKLSRAHLLILILHFRRKIGMGRRITEATEKIAYGLYAEALNELECSTNYRFPFPRDNGHGHITNHLHALPPYRLDKIEP